MKKILALVLALTMCLGVFSFAAAESVEEVIAQAQTMTPTDPMVAGQGAGNALHALYTQYKADGNKFNYKNTQNILNTVTLIANCENLKTQYKDKTYLQNFGKGLIASSMGLVTQQNVTTVTNSLVDMVKNSETVQNATTSVQNTASTAAGYANTASQYASALSTLLGAFSGK